MSRIDDIGFGLENPMSLSGFVRFFSGSVKKHLLDPDPEPDSPEPCPDLVLGWYSQVGSVRPFKI